jgi:hypothetical protein
MDMKTWLPQLITHLPARIGDLATSLADCESGKSAPHRQKWIVGGRSHDAVSHAQGSSGRERTVDTNDLAHVDGRSKTGEIWYALKMERDAIQNLSKTCDR